MTPILMFVSMLFASLIVGYVLGRFHERQAAREAAERLRRLDPPRRTAGAPTNLDAPPSDVGRPKWRTGYFKTGPHSDD